MKSLAICISLLVGGVAMADEGMWTYNGFPRALVKDRYGFEITDGWLDHVRLSSVRFNSGGSASFVSSRGLVMTNHHVGADCINKLGTARKDHDYIKDGFYARSSADEIKCPDLELNVVLSIDDVTKDVKSVEKPGMDEAAINVAQKSKMAQLEKACATAKDLRCEVVTLYQGGVFNLYKYKKYTDVRLAFAPEGQIAFFGGDPDNFMFPRYDLDVAFFRVYENGQAVHPTDYLKWSAAGAKEGELVFTSGNPGNTERLDTLSQLDMMRSTSYPNLLKEFRRIQKTLRDYQKRGGDAERQAHTPLFYVENSIKALTGYLGGLNDKTLMEIKKSQEMRLKAQVASLKDKDRYIGIWSAIDAAEHKYASFYKRYIFAEPRTFRHAMTLLNPLGSTMFGYARTIVRALDEKAKPNDNRLPEFRDSSLASTEQSLFSAAPVYPALEEALMASALERLKVELGDDDTLTRLALDGKSPQQRAHEIITTTQLADPAARRKLYSDPAALKSSTDPMIMFARALDPEARALRKRYEDEVESVVKKNLGLLARAQFETAGLTHYPDATFTLRLSFGKVAGYKEAGKNVPAMTDFAGLYARADKANNQSPWDLPPKWVTAKSKLNLKTPMDFESTNDIIGGNSGSPVVNRAGEVVGLIFDGNIYSLANNFVYRDTQDRATSVTSVALTEALRKVYDAAPLADELSGQGAGGTTEKSHATP